MLKRKEFILGAAVGLTFAAAATAGGIIDWPAAGAQEQRAELRGGLVPASTAGAVLFQPPPGAPNSFADIIEQVSPAVVQIDVTTRVPRPTMRGFPNIPGLPFPFSVPQQPQGPGGEEGEPPTMEGAGSGSGFFISADGYIVTNNHVVENASEITVRLTDDRELTARIVGRDPETDLAVLKVEGGTFPFVEFETSAQPRVGDWVVALGNPFGLGGSATAGIVSARGRDIGEAYVDYIQIDAPINRGNSGGPTFDIYGRVIGVNTAIFSPTGVSVGIGFAIPADTAQRVTQQLMQGGSIQRGYLGVEIGTLTSDYREALGLSDDVQGAYVNSTTPGGPADQGGVQAGDIVVELDGQAVRNNTDLTRRVGQAAPGDTLRLTVLREGRRVQLSVRSGVRPSAAELNAQGADAEGAPRPGQPETPAGTAIEGLTVAPMTSALRERHSIPSGVNGLVITGVASGSTAATRGFAPGMVIVQADGRAISTVAEFRQAVQRVRETGRPGVLLLVRTPNGNRPVVLELDSDEE
ncbi:MAG: Do family serine endopeptidase [Brevundimonas sp.]